MISLAVLRWLRYLRRDAGYRRLVAQFTPGLELAESFYREVVAAIVGSRQHSAALLGEGSEVLGFDSERSTDHAWGPRLQLFVDAVDAQALRSDLDARLPEHYRGWPVRFYRWQTSQVDHHVEVLTLDDWLSAGLGFDPRDGVPIDGWLSTPQQVLLEVTAGAVFHDGDGTLTEVRERLAWYPHEVWLWMMAAQWMLIADREPLIGRTAEAGDRLGSRLAAALLARDVMRLALLQERQYAPYDKWLGTTFSRLRTASRLELALDRLVAAADYPSMEEALVEAMEEAACRHNALGMTGQLEPRAAPYAVGINDAVRPYRVLNAIRFSRACREAITNPALRRLEPIGAIDQVANPSDLLIHFTDLPRRLRITYRELLRSQEPA